MKQQDAYEYHQHLLQTFQLNKYDLSHLFDFKLEQRIKCKNCQKVKYRISDEGCLDLYVNTTKINGEFNPVTFDECLNGFFGDGMNTEYQCPQCRIKTVLETRSRMNVFPECLVIVLKRFYFDESYSMKKLGTY